MSSSVDPLFDWYVVRDTLFGSNKYLQNVKKALSLLSPVITILPVGCCRCLPIAP
jgi:hypothetical protein